MLSPNWMCLNYNMLKCPEDWWISEWQRTGPKFGLAPKPQSSDRYTCRVGHLAGSDPHEPHSNLSHAVPDLCLMWSFFSSEPTATLLYCIPSWDCTETSLLCRHALCATGWGCLWGKSSKCPGDTKLDQSIVRIKWHCVLHVQQRIRSENAVSLLYCFLWIWPNIPWHLPYTVLAVTLELQALVLLHSLPLTHLVSWQVKEKGGQRSCTWFPVKVLWQNREGLVLKHERYCKIEKALPQFAITPHSFF